MKFKVRIKLGTPDEEAEVAYKRLEIYNLGSAGRNRTIYEKNIDAAGTELEDQYDEKIDTTSEPGFWILEGNYFVTNIGVVNEFILTNVASDGRESPPVRSVVTTQKPVPAPPAPVEMELIPGT